MVTASQLIRKVEDVDDRPIFANSEAAAVLESLEGRFSGLTW